MEPAMRLVHGPYVVHGLLCFVCIASSPTGRVGFIALSFRAGAGEGIVISTGVIGRVVAEFLLFGVAGGVFVEKLWMLDGDVFVVVVMMLG